MRRLLLALALVLPLVAANLKLYLKDGSYHIVREYKVEGDRIRYYTRRAQRIGRRSLSNSST